MKEDMSPSNLGTVALHVAKVPTNVFSSTLICILTLDYTTPTKWSDAQPFYIALYRENKKKSLKLQSLEP